MKNPLNEVFSEGNGDGLCAVRGIYLVENGAHVVVDAVEANPKQGCDVPARSAWRNVTRVVISESGDIFARAGKCHQKSKI